MAQLLSDLTFILPEITLLAGILLMPVILLFKKIQITILSRMMSGVFLLNLILAFAATRGHHTLFSNQIFITEATWYGRIILAFSGSLVALLFKRWFLKKGHAEYFLFTMTLQLGAQLMLIAGHAISFILSIELMSISSYALSGFLFTERSSESGIKFFLFGSTSTALLVFGFSWVYGQTGALSLQSLSDLIQSNLSPGTLGFTGLLLIIIALTFKITAAPMHWWAPDVFQASPYPVIAILSAIPKISVVLLLARISGTGAGNEQNEIWLIIIAVLAMMTLLAGNFPALLQTNAKRLMGYSSIGQAGFLLTGICVAPGQLTYTLLFYALAMMTGVTLVVYCLDWFEKNINAVNLSDFSGKGKITLVPSVGITVGLLSLTGLPPFAGFSAKLLIFTGLWGNPGSPAVLQIALLVFGILNTVIALFYYIKIPLKLFLGENANPVTEPTCTAMNYIVIIGLSLILVFLFLFPGLF